MRAAIFGLGSALPEAVVTNADLVARGLDTDDDWIVRRTGIRERRILPAGEPLAALAAEAAQRALEDAGRDGDDVDHVLVSSLTPDDLMPGLAPEVAVRVGAREAAAVDLNAACSGFLYALDHAAALVESGRAGLVLVVAAEALSRITDSEDRGTAILFGDGAGAFVVGPGTPDVGCARFVLGSDGAQAGLLHATQAERLIRMEGQEVYRHAVARMVAATRDALALADMRTDDLDLFVAHQANARIIAAVGRELGLPEEKVMLDVDRVANTSSASIPLALQRARDDGRLVEGATVGLATFGAGFTWGAGVVSIKERAYVTC